MTCLRPLCERKASVGVHCAKCRKRFMTRKHNARYRNAQSGFLPSVWPCYDGTDLTGWVDALVSALEQSS